jgi:hypothetical protein
LSIVPGGVWIRAPALTTKLTLGLVELGFTYRCPIIHHHASKPFFYPRNDYSSHFLEFAALHVWIFPLHQLYPGETDFRVGCRSFIACIVLANVGCIVEALEEDANLG